MSVYLVIASSAALACVFLVIGVLRKRWGWAYSWTWKPKLSLSLAIRSIVCISKCFCGSPSGTNPSSKSIEDVETSEDRVDKPGIAGSRDAAPGLNESDLKELISLINENDGGPPWQPLMEKSTATLVYRAWYRDSPTGPTQYRTRTIFKNVSPKVVRDFFWDDEFRIKWDKMLVEHRTLHVSPKDGSMLVRWIRKLPVIGSEREYIIVRRIWESQTRYYCVTKGTECLSLPKRKTPRRVECYYSSYLINSVEVDEGQEHTEVLLFHHEDSGLPKEIVRMAARAGIWGLVKRMDTAVQSYSIVRASGAPPSEFARHAAVTTKFRPSTIPIEHTRREAETTAEKRKDSNAPWWLVLGGIVIVSCLTVHTAKRKTPMSAAAGRCLWRFPMNKN
ncbi:hypothetical protein MLD38_004261 [Melastoma candidum]|uniref:Uncharacterized protein n=1 Tax=Melastoma candidum TaxID=119954 RepID=A0ACB9S569_9MYRT|nr:hypothetical protein MLD38_004261 [Melastoma candidum]